MMFILFCAALVAAIGLTVVTVAINADLQQLQFLYNTACQRREELILENQALRKANATLTETNKDIDSEYRKALGTIQQVREFLDPKPIVFTNCTFHGKSNEELST